MNSETVLSSYTCLHHYFAIQAWRACHKRGMALPATRTRIRQLCLGGGEQTNLNRRRGVFRLQHHPTSRDDVSCEMCEREREMDKIILVVYFCVSLIYAYIP